MQQCVDQVTNALKQCLGEEKPFDDMNKPQQTPTQEIMTPAKVTDNKPSAPTKIDGGAGGAASPAPRPKVNVYNPRPEGRSDLHSSSLART